MVEDEQQNDEDDLVEELSPSLHQEGTGDLAATMKTVILGRDFARSDSVLHTSSRSHGVLASDTDTVEEESPDVADDPAVLGNAPCGSKHEKTDEHDDGVLNETIAATQPVAEDTNKNLT